MLPELRSCPSAVYCGPVPVKYWEFPITESNKILKCQLRAEHWERPDPVWRADPERGYALMTPKDREALRLDFAARQREQLLDLGAK